jgi:FtsX-like permease family
MATVSAAVEPGRPHDGARAQRLLVPVRFALRRMRAQAQRTVVVAVGIAVGAAVLALTAVCSGAVQDRAVQRALGQLQPSDRAIQAFWSGVPAQSNLSAVQLDRLARRALTPVLRQPPFGVEVFRQATWGGAFVNLGAVDGLSRWIVLRSGRLPRVCLPTDCELVQIGGAPVAPHLPYLHVVGRATFRTGAPLGSYFGGTGKRPPILLANGALRFSRVPLPDAGVIARTYGWIVPVAPGAIHDWELPSLGARIDRAQAQLEQVSDIFGVSAPTDAIAAIRATSRVSGERVLILGGDAAVLLLGFAVLASTRLRRSQRAVRRRLTWAGARRSQILLVAATEVAAITVVASVAGWAAGTGAGALLAHHLGAPGWLAAEHSVLTLRAFAIAVALAVLTALVMLAALHAEAVAFGGLALTVADVAALGALGAVLLALARGKADAGTLAAGDGTGVLLLLLPALVLFVLAVAVARVVAPFLRLLEWGGRRAPARVRLALLSLARAPGQVLLAVVFFVLSVGVALFAIAYRATLERGVVEEAHYAVPAPYVLQENVEQLVPVQQAATGAQYASLGRITPVLRDSGFVSAAGGRDFTLLALPASSLARIGGWRSDFSSRTPAELARLLRPPATPHLRGIALPSAATRVTLPFTVRGDQLGVTLMVLNRRGDFSTLVLGEFGNGEHAPSVRVPAPARGGRVVALRLSFPVIAAFVAGHRESGTTLSVSDASTGVLRLGRLRAGRTVLAPFGSWIGTGGIRTDGSLLHYVLNRAADSIYRPREPLEGEAVPVIVSPALARTAGPGGDLPLNVDEQVIDARVVGVASNIPSVDGDAVVADLPTWFVAENTLDPGTAVPSELWLDAPPSAAARLARPPFAVLSVTSERATQANLRGDPLARGALALLLVAAAVGLALAVAGLLLTVIGDLRDESGELFDLEAQGATPADIRRHLFLRASVVAALGLLGGLAAGAVVSALVVAVVAVTAGAGTPLPSLQLIFDWKVVALALAAVAACGVAASFAATRLAYDRVARWRFSEGIE